MQRMMTRELQQK